MAAVAVDPIFQPLAFRNLTIENRILRSNIAGRFDGYDDSREQMAAEIMSVFEPVE